MLGTQIRNLRKGRHYSQMQLAASIGVSKQSVSNWENNNITPSVEIIRKLADFFGCTTDYILEREGKATLITANLTDEQLGHVLQIVRDLETLNEKLQ